MSRRITSLFSLVLVLSFLLSGVVRAIDSKSALLVWWPLDEGQGTAAVDHSGNGYDGVFKGQPQWVAGYEGSALQFDGVDDYVAFDFPAAESMGAFTVTLWLKCATLGQVNYAAAFAGHYPNSAGFQLDVDGGNPGNYRINPSGLIFGPASTDWVHLTLAAKGTAATLYYNGVQTATGNLSDTRWDEFSLGANRNRTIWWAGACDDLRVYNRTMQADQVRGLYQGMAPDFSKAIAPDPANGATQVIIPIFGWTAGDGAWLHDVYLGTSPELTEADRVATRLTFTKYYHVPGLQPGVTYYWRIDEVEADMATVHPGDVWTFTAQALTAYLPEPADGSVDAPLTPMLRWLPGQQAAKHHVYFSDNVADVNAAAAAADKGQVAEPSFAPGALASVTMYYWRVDETVFDGTIRAGAVWHFTTALPVDDFESYNDDEGQGTRIYETWIDGYADGSSGSTVGYTQAPFAEQTIVHGGRQSMPLDYNNVKAPFYSEAVREFTPVQNWTVNGVADLKLDVRGRAGNGAGSLYLVVEDSGGKSAVVTYPDPAIVTTTSWTEWKIPLDSLTGVNLAKVKKLYLGIGDRKSPTAGGAGRIYIDDIRVTKP
jgi:hypothetical protein